MSKDTRICSVQECKNDDSRAPLSRGYCSKHYARWRKYGSTDDRSTSHTAIRKTFKGECIHCGSSFDAGNSLAKYCSKFCSSWARYLGPDCSLYCETCSIPMLAGPDSRKLGARCDGCSPEHGANGYAKGCRCSICRAAKAAYQRFFGRKRFEETGSWPRGDWIKKDIRFAVYERDDWICQICLEPVDIEAHYLDKWAPSLDHIEPQSHTIVPNHDPENLRTAHRFCNGSRGDRTEVPDEVIAVQARALRRGDLLGS